MEILLILLIIFVIFPLFRVLFSVGKSVHTFKKAFNQQAEQFNNAQKQQSEKAEKESRKERAREFFKRTGEDVAFEEIKTDRDIKTDNDSSASSHNHSNDSHISDAKYEEVK